MCKKNILPIAVFIALYTSLSAQSSTISDSIIVRKSNGLLAGNEYFYRGIELNPRQLRDILIANESSAESYRKTKKPYNYGAASMGVGLLSSVIGLISISGNGYGDKIANPTQQQQDDAKRNVRIGYTFLGSGVALLTTGFVLQKRGKRQLERSIEDFNSGIATKSKLGYFKLNQKGFSLSLSFHF